jgi:hypothetical protein
MFLNFTNAESNEQISVNKDNVVCLFTAKDDDGVSRTVLSVVNGNIAIAEPYLEALRILNQ